MTNGTIEVWTIQMSKWRLAKQREIFFLDITAKSGHQCFAPHFSDVMKYKRGEMEEEEYTKIYLEKMAESRIKFPVKWGSLKNHPRIALACYCPPDVFCHRHLFKRVMEEFLKEFDIDVEYKGELLT